MKEYLPELKVERNSSANFSYSQRLNTEQSYDSSEIINLKAYWRIIAKQKKLILACVLGCLMLSVIYAFTATPLYTALSQIKIGTYQPILTNAKIEDLLQQHFLKRHLSPVAEKDYKKVHWELRPDQQHI